ncbi:MAG: B-box zinc finger protein [Deltaproteobacteria bacterium]|nr:B-box zinc finger protein [Deltaproteobacteria bacterium]
MQCKYHPERQAEQFCTTCGIPLCQDCVEETNPGQYFCFQCAMLQTVSIVGTSIVDKREKAVEKKAKKEKKWGPFHYFLIVSSVLILVMWGIIMFGGQKPPEYTVDFTKHTRAFLFMVDGAVKSYAHYEGSRYPEKLSDLIPRYLSMRDEDLVHLNILSYQRDPGIGYRLSLANPKPGEMNVTISPRGIQYQ